MEDPASSAELSRESADMVAPKNFNLIYIRLGGFSNCFPGLVDEAESR